MEQAKGLIEKSEGEVPKPPTSFQLPLNMKLKMYSKSKRVMEKNGRNGIGGGLERRRF